MAFEMLMLGFSTLLLMLSGLPGLVAKYRVFGPNRLLSGRFGEERLSLPVWAQRCVQVQADLMKSYPPFAVAVLLLAFTGGFTAGTALTSALFLGARMVHIPAMIADLSLVRFLAWLAGFIATLYLLFMALVALVSF